MHMGKIDLSVTILNYSCYALSSTHNIQAVQRKYQKLKSGHALATAHWSFVLDSTFAFFQGL